MSAFARLHRTALMDHLTSCLWGQVAAQGHWQPSPSQQPTQQQQQSSQQPQHKVASEEGLPSGFYQPRCNHTVSLRSVNPLQVGGCGLTLEALGLRRRAPKHGARGTPCLRCVP